MDSLHLYDFDLPKDLIASMPTAERGASKLLCLLKHEKQPRHDAFKNIHHYLRPHDVLVINNTKVMKARVYAYKPTGGLIEILLVRPLPHGLWHVLIKGLKHPLGKCLSLGSMTGPSINVVDKAGLDDQGYIIASEADLFDYAAQYGEMPLPPYMERKALAIDDIRYQTVYAKELGAVAAPTAGLHFTSEHLSSLKDFGVDVAEITLHVGPGTFLPVRHDNINDHVMHKEWFKIDSVSADKLNRAKKNGGRIIAVGSTAMRTLEQASILVKEEHREEFFAVSQETNIFIKPGHKFLACDALITNFHTPKSTLVILVSAVAGRERVLNAYQEAIKRGYKFFSYGDACFMEVCS